MAHKHPHIQKLLEDRYYLRDEDGNLLETDPDEMYLRVAKAVSLAETDAIKREEYANMFYDLMWENKFLPNTPTLINAGKPSAGTFSGCFVLPVEDSMDDIFTAVKQSAMIFKAGGGIGYNFGNLREEGAIVKSTGQKSGGPISFMKSFDAMCDTVKQGGARRGAMMGVLPVWHPDIEKFVELKQDGFSFSNFNISVGITDEFMDCVENEDGWDLYSPTGDFLDPVKSINAKDLWNKIVENAWKTGDPGLVFLDTINKAHPLKEGIEATNPCGEIPLRPYESCNLGSINLMAYIKRQSNDVPDCYMIDFDSLEKDIPTMVRFLDDVIDVNPFPLPEVEKASKESRKIGLGVMGWADCLIKMNIPYDSQEALDLAEKLMLFIYEKVDKASAALAVEKGNYPLRSDLEIEKMGYKRNATLLCVAPTGTLSRIAGVSSGIEPVFAWNIHHQLEGHEYDEQHWAWEEWEQLDYALDATGSKRVPVPRYMRTAGEIKPEWHLKMQAVFQQNIDNSVSKTINLPNSATKEDIDKIYWESWGLGLKGITIYRDGSKDNQPLNKIQEKNIGQILKSALGEGSGLYVGDKKVADIVSYESSSMYRKRGPVTVGVTHKVDTGRGKIYITINYSEYHSVPVEAFIRLGYLSTPTEAALAEWAGRLISLLLKHSVPVENIIRQGNKVYSDTVFWYNGQSFCSFPKLISHLLGFTFEEAMDMANMDFESMMENGDEYYEVSEEVEKTGEYCYTCGAYAVIAEGGCKVCQNCGKDYCG